MSKNELEIIIHAVRLSLLLKMDTVVNDLSPCSRDD